ncbi:glycosyltransferase [Candidatus Saganbacteria bacterium]|nr:glycosyltransferase [Candidatus Saganbacteria bacterium]
MNKVSLITILLNEEDSIGGLIKSILAQDKKPDEIIYVDGGSTDKTVSIINDHLKAGAPIKLIVAPGTNSAQAENIAIKNAKYEWIAITDAGCKVGQDWLRKLTVHFAADVDIVSGVYSPDCYNLFEEALADVIFPRLNEIDDSFNPSNRSIAFRKSVWSALGGYNEGLRRSDDTWFIFEARRRNMRFRLAKDAIVYWRPRKNIRELFKYSYTDERSCFLHNVFLQITVVFPYYFHTAKLFAMFGLPIVLLFIRPQYLYLWLTIMAVYLLAKSLKYYYSADKRKPTKLLLYPLIIMAIDSASFLGMLAGLFARYVNMVSGRAIIKD